jgi:hypothetical protein
MAADSKRGEALARIDELLRRDSDLLETLTDEVQALTDLRALLLAERPTCQHALHVLRQLQCVHQINVLYASDPDPEPAEAAEPALKRARLDASASAGAGLDSSTAIAFMDACFRSVAHLPGSESLAASWASHACDLGLDLEDGDLDGEARQRALAAAWEVWSATPGPGPGALSSERATALMRRLLRIMRPNSWEGPGAVNAAFAAARLLSHMGLVHAATPWEAECNSEQESSEEEEEEQPPCWAVHQRFLRACAGLLQLQHTADQRLQLAKALAAYVLRPLRTRGGSKISFTTIASDLAPLLPLLLWGALQQQHSKALTAALLPIFDRRPDYYFRRQLHHDLDALCGGQQPQEKPLCPHPLEVLAAALEVQQERSEGAEPEGKPWPGQRGLQELASDLPALLCTLADGSSSPQETAGAAQMLSVVLRWHKSSISAAHLQDALVALVQAHSRCIRQAAEAPQGAAEQPPASQVPGPAPQPARDSANRAGEPQQQPAGGSHQQAAADAPPADASAAALRERPGPARSVLSCFEALADHCRSYPFSPNAPSCWQLLALLEHCCGHVDAWGLLKPLAGTVLHVCRYLGRQQMRSCTPEEAEWAGQLLRQLEAQQGWALPSLSPQLFGQQEPVATNVDVAPPPAPPPVQQGTAAAAAAATPPPAAASDDQQIGGLAAGAAAADADSKALQQESAASERRAEAQLAAAAQQAAQALAAQALLLSRPEAWQQLGVPTGSRCPPMDASQLAESAAALAGLLAGLSYANSVHAAVEATALVPRLWQLWSSCLDPRASLALARVMLCLVEGSSEHIKQQFIELGAQRKLQDMIQVCRRCKLTSCIDEIDIHSQTQLLE